MTSPHSALALERGFTSSEGPHCLGKNPRGVYMLLCAYSIQTTLYVMCLGEVKPSTVPDFLGQAPVSPDMRLALNLCPCVCISGDPAPGPGKTQQSGSTVLRWLEQNWKW